MCMDVTVYECNRGILQILIFLFFNSTLVTGKDCCSLPLLWPRSLVQTILLTDFPLMLVTFVVIGNGQRLLSVTNIVAQVTGTSGLVTGFSLMPVTCVSYW
jgi:hypothetical protein